MTLLVTPTFEVPTAGDLDDIRALRSASGLPVDDVDEHVARFILAKWKGSLIGTVAVEYAGEAALLRSFSVAASYRAKTVGARLLSAIEGKAASNGVRELYLLTTSAAAFFEQRGFSRTSRADAPLGIRNTAQFRKLCPSTAICLRKTLPSSATELAGAP